MNITLAGTKVSMDGHTLAFQKNNLVDSMVITVDTDETWQYKLDVKYPCKDSNGKELYNVIDLTRVGNTCTAILQATMLPFNGKYTMQLRGISGNKVYHTDTFDVWVKYSIDPGKVYDPVPSEFYQIESNITSMNNHPPKPGDNGYWLVWNVAKQEYEESDVPLPEGTLPEVSDSTNGWYLTNDGERVYWAEVQGGSGEGDITAIQVNGIDQPIVDKVAKLTIDKDTVGLGNLDNVRQYSSVNQPPYPVTSVNGQTGVVQLDIPTALPNPNALTIKTGSTTTTYDGSSAQTVDVPKDDNPLGITGAQVGQIAKITAVDASGVPTAWSPVDMPSGGGETWETINVITLSDAVNTVAINQDSGGNAIALKKVRILVVGSATANQDLFLNNSRYIRANVVGTAASVGALSAEPFCGKMYCFAVTNNIANYTAINQLANIFSKEITITEIKLIVNNSGTFSAGTKFTIQGVRA